MVDAEIEDLKNRYKSEGDAENIWYNRNRSYDTAMGLKAIAYNLMVISNT